MTTPLPLQAVRVLLQVDDHAPVPVRIFVTDRAQCGRTQIGVALVELGEDFLSSAARAEGWSA